MRSKLVKDYLLPIRVIDKSDNILNENLLLEREYNQVYIGEQDYMLVKGKGFIILDFGKELQGGLRILNGRSVGPVFTPIRIRFGESVMETCAELGEKNATNNHAIRDYHLDLPVLSDQTFGQTGFRFVRIDFLEDIEYHIVNLYASFEHRDLEYIGQFECSDHLINKIYDTARYTLFLNLQENLFEGIKRDRLVWVGDMQPEVLAFSYLFDDYSIVKNAIDDSIKFNPLPCWFGQIPTYSFWLIDILYILYKNTKDKEYILSKMDYVNGVIDQLDKCVSSNGIIDYSLSDAKARGFFFDWPCNNHDDSKEGNRFVFIYTLNHYLTLCRELNINPHSKVRDLLVRLNNDLKLQLSKKQVIALGYLAQKINKEETKNKLFNRGANGLSTFFSYFILKAMSEVGDMEDTLAILKEYYGGMLSIGATSFFEDFDINWLKDASNLDEITPNNKKDIHGDNGDWCYKGYRHSLCHGWSVGPISFLIENIIGFSLYGNELTIKPNLGNLNYAKAIVPSFYGPISIDIKKEKDELIINVNKPEEIIYLK